MIKLNELVSLFPYDSQKVSIYSIDRETEVHEGYIGDFPKEYGNYIVDTVIMELDNSMTFNIISEDAIKEEIYKRAEEIRNELEFWKHVVKLYEEGYSFREIIEKGSVNARINDISSEILEIIQKKIKNLKEDRWHLSFMSDRDRAIGEKHD